MPYVLLYLFPAALAAELALFGWQQRPARAAAPFSLLMAAVVFWSACHALSAASSTLPATLFWAQLQYGGIVLVGPIWLLFSLAYSGAWARATRAQRGALLIPAGLAYLAVLTNEWHHLWWPTVALDESRPFGSLRITHGTLFWLHYSYSYGCILLGAALIVRAMLFAPTAQRRTARLLALSVAFPIAGNAAHVLGYRTLPVDDPTPLLFTATGLLIFYAALRYRFLDLATIAQQALFASMPDGLVVLDSRGIIAASNDSAPTLLAAEPRRWLGRSLRDVVAGSPLEIDVRALLTQPLGATATRSIAYEAAEGARALELRLRPLDVDHAHAGALLVVRDRTDRAQMERVLDRRLSDVTAINRIARAANAALAIEDILRSSTRELVRILPADRVLVGLLESDSRRLRIVVDEERYGAARLEGHAIAGAAFARLEQLLHAGRSRMLHATEPLLMETSLEHMGLQAILVVPLASHAGTLGAMFVGQAQASAIAPDDKRLCETVGELLAEAMTRTRLYEQAQQASRAKSTFLAMVTHELRTPLTSIIGFADLLTRGLYGSLPARANQPISQIRRNSHILLRLINDFLDFSKAEAGHLMIELEPVDLPVVMHDVAHALQPQIKERGLALEIQVASNLPRVFADRERLAQVLTNLVANAVKFTEQGSITLTADTHGEYVSFSVADTGIGIAAEEHERLFQEFQQIPSAHAGGTVGTGLGLAISRGLMRLMGGTLTVESTPGLGSTFSGELPIVREQERGATVEEQG
jgi:signal transduction histidine kinase/PAS domain-containing protein